ncbi:MAG TPA: HlyD family secretion protein [Terriglobia bacterium]|nr:HlyD family secretion protein [Terriglobia bacterium]
MADDSLTKTMPVEEAESNDRVPGISAGSDSEASHKTRRLWKFILVLAGVCAAAVIITILNYYGKVTTDDAQVDAHITAVSPRVPGYVQKLFVNDNQPIKQGDALAEIDPRDYRAAVAQAQAAYDTAVASARTAKLEIGLTRDATASSVEGALAAKAAAEAGLLRTKASLEETATAALKAAEANVQAKLASNERAQADLARYRPLVKTGDVSELRFDAIEATARVYQSELNLANQQLAEAHKAVDIAKAQADAAAANLSRSEAQLRGSQAQRQQVPVREMQYQSSLAAVERAKAQLEEARLQLGYTLVRAPISGHVTEKNVQLGDYVSPGQLLLTIVPLQDIYVTANYKETQLANVKVGQKAIIRADMYGNGRFQGVVDSIAASTGSEQALLPPQNATGNFVKVVQRIPVKIRVLKTMASDTVLRPGMNVEVTIYVH